MVYSKAAYNSNKVNPQIGLKLSTGKPFQVRKQEELVSIQGGAQAACD